VAKTAAYRNRIEVLQGTLDLLVLQTLQWGPRHGYGITRAIQAGSGERLKVDTGSLYPALHRLERQRFIQAEWKTSENKQRVAATMDAFFEYVAGDTGAFRLVFESDLTNEPAVRERVDRVTTDCAAMIALVIHEDTGLPDAEARLLAVSLVGMAQVSARFWLSEASGIKPLVTQGDAAALVAGLAWRGIRGYPLTDEH